MAAKKKTPSASSRLQISYVQIETLKHPDYNPRLIDDKDFEQLKKSLTSFDAVEPAIVNTHGGRENIIVGGNQRVRAAKALGWQEFPVVYLDLTLEREKELNVRLNRNTGIFDNKKLSTEFNFDDLKSWGFLDEEINALGDVKKELDAIGKDGKDKGTTNLDNAEVKDVTKEYGDASMYCALPLRLDVGTDICTHGCLYCFTRCTPASVHKKVGTVGLTKKDLIRKILREGKETNQTVSVGLCNDPCLPEFRERLMFTLQEAHRLGVFLYVHTKNPAPIMAAVKEVEADPTIICFKVSFSMCTDAKAKILEPNAPNVTARVAMLNEAVAAGYDTVIRLQPYFIDYYEGMDKVLGAVKGCDRVIVEPCRISATGKAYFQDVEKALDKDNKSLDAYLGRLKREGHALYGALHWYDIDPKLLRKSLEYIKGLCKKNGKLFGISSMEFGIPNMDLNDGEFCCQTKRIQKQGLNFDRLALCAMSAAGRLKEYEVPILKCKECSDAKTYFSLVNRIGAYNDFEAKGMRLR